MIEYNKELIKKLEAKKDLTEKEKTSLYFAKFQLKELEAKCQKIEKK